MPSCPTTIAETQIGKVISGQTLRAAMDARPNFFIVGAPKAGTTSLYHYLDQHPQIYMSPIKEPCYFASEIRPENFGPELQDLVARETQALRKYLDGPMREKRFGGTVTCWEDYLRLFRGVREEKAIGEASVCYLWSKTAARNIAAQIPDARILMILRDPAERAFSQYAHLVTNGQIRMPFQEYIRSGLRSTGGKFGIFHPFLEFGLYYEQVKRFLELFPIENIRIYFYEDYRKQPAGTLADVCRFLEVSDSFTPDLSSKYLEPQVPRSIAIGYALKKYGVWQRAKLLIPQALGPFARKLVFRRRKSLAMARKDRKCLIDYYREDIDRLSQLLNRDLSAWLSV
jgi:Sulfotransferase family